MSGYHLRGVLNGITCLFIGAGMLEDVGGENIPHIMRPMRKQIFDRAPLGVRIEDAVTLDHEPPGLIEGALVV